MADITMCDNQSCHKRIKCYRVRAEASDYQSWAIFRPDDGGECEFFIEYVLHTRKADKADNW